MRGGKNAAENLVILCGECHGDAPDYIEPEFMVRWMIARPEWSSALYEQMLALLGTYEIDISVASTVILGDGFRQFFRDRAGYHIGGSRAGRLSTAMAALADYCSIWKPRRIVRRRGRAA